MENTDIVSVEVNASQVPSIIQEQFDGLKLLKQNVSEATKKAEDAKASAKLAKEKSARAFQKKEAIESLQKATSDLADAQISAAQAQEVSFEYQQKIAEITKYLFALGVSNIAMNRSVVRELELKLKGASEEELDEFARQEIIAVVKQLKAQEDIMKKQSDLTEKVEAHEATLRSHVEKDKEYDKLIAVNKQKTIEHDKLLAEKAKKDKSQDEEIARQAAMDAELGERIDAGEEKDKNQDEEIARQAAKDEELAKQISQLMASNLEKETQIRELQAICEKLSKNISDNALAVDDKATCLLDRINEKASKKSVIVSYLIGLAGVIAAVVQFFIWLSAGMV